MQPLCPLVQARIWNAERELNVLLGIKLSWITKNNFIESVYLFHHLFIRLHWAGGFTAVNANPSFACILCKGGVPSPFLLYPDDECICVQLLASSCFYCSNFPLSQYWLHLINTIQLQQIHFYKRAGWGKIGLALQKQETGREYIASKVSTQRVYSCCSSTREFKMQPLA